MEEQDLLILTSLKRMEFQLPGTVGAIQDIDGEILQSISIQFLKKLGFQSKPVNSTQKFRIATKIQEDLKKEGGIRLEVNTLMNPNPQELRKILISMVSRISMSENNDTQQQKVETYQEKVDNQKEQIKLYSIDNWITEEWVHPCLLNEGAHSKPFRIYETNVALDNKSLQRVLVINNFDQEVKPNFFSSLARIIDHSRQKVLEQESQNDKFYNGGNQQELNAEKHTKQVKDMVKKNAKEWNNLKKKKIAKLAQKMKETEEVQKDDKEQTLFELEQQFQNDNENKLETENAEFDLDKLKKDHEEEINQIQEKIDVINSKINKFDNKRTNMETNITDKTEEVSNYREANKQLQQNVEQLHLLLQQIENRGGYELLSKEVQQLENDINNMELEWSKIRNGMESSINDFRLQVNERKEKMDQQREKARRLENEYVTIVGDIRNAYDQKEALRAECERLPKEIYGRHKYVRSITEIGKNFNKQKEEIKKIVKDVDEQDEVISGYSTTLNRYYVEFENAFNTDSKKKESLHVQIYKLYDEYRGIFKKTIDTLKDSATKKIEIREIEGKIETISSKGYNHSVGKLQNDLNDIKVENQQFQGQYDQYRAVLAQQEQQVQQQQQQQQQGQGYY